MSQTQKDFVVFEKNLKGLQQDVRNLRDSDNHVCQGHLPDACDCSCGEYDAVIDKLDDLLEEAWRLTGL